MVAELQAELNGVTYRLADAPVAVALAHHLRCDRENWRPGGGGHCEGQAGKQQGKGLDLGAGNVCFSSQPGRSHAERRLNPVWRYRPDRRNQVHVCRKDR